MIDPSFLIIVPERDARNSESMFTATADIVLPTTIVGSLPRPSWYTENLGRRNFREAMVVVERRTIDCGFP